MTGPSSSSNPSQALPPAVVISPENEKKRVGFDRNFAGFIRHRPATISDDPGMDLEPLELFLLPVVLDLRYFCILEID
ncbi:unnamed protein product [Prunus armeniaca]